MALTKISTDGVKDDAVTTDKLANAINTERTANTAKVSTTINNNADNRVITGSGTANTLNGEANLTFSSSLLVSDGNGSVNVGGNYALLKRTSGTTNYIAAPNADAVLDISADETIRFGTVNTGDFNSTERMRIDSSGNVGIGMTPAAPLHVTGATADTLRLTNGANASIYYKIGRNHLDGKLEFRGTQSGDECYSFGGVSGEKIRFQPAGGISFNGDTAAANALDDYEEGTWTPVLYVDGASSSSGKYTKIGRMVYATFQIVANSSSSGTHQYISGLPFTTHNAVPNAGGVARDYQTYDVENGPVYHVSQDDTIIYLYKNGGQNLSGSNLSGLQIRGTAVYTAA